jgi:K319L-like, PKD domain
LVFVARFDKKGENMKLLRNLGGALSLALLVGLVLSSVPLGAQTVTAFTAERSLSLTNILTTVTPTASPAVLAAIAAGAVEIREQTSLNAVNGTLSSTFFIVPTGSPNPTNLALLPFSAFVASTTLTIDRTYVTSTPVAVAFVGRVTQSTATPFGNYAGASGTYSFGYTSDTPPKINNVIETINGLIVLYSPAATGTFTIVGLPTTGGGGGGGVSVVINGSSDAAPTFTTVLNQVVLDASATTTSTGGTLSFAWATAAGSPSASIIGGSTSKATIQLGAGKGVYKFTLTVTDSKGTAPTVVNVTVNYV